MRRFDHFVSFWGALSPAKTLAHMASMSGDGWELVSSDTRWTWVWKRPAKRGFSIMKAHAAIMKWSEAYECMKYDDPNRVTLPVAL